MDRVLGLSMTANVIRWVLVDGVTGEGATVDRGALAIADVDAFDAEALLETLLDDGELHAVGLTWSAGADAAAIKARAALAVLGGGAQVAAVTDVQATEVLAGGIAGLGDYGFLVVCTAEPDATVVATVTAQGVAAQRLDATDGLPPVDGVNALVRGVRPSPDAIFVLGSGEADTLAAALREATTRPVLTAADAEFALARGAALAAARALTVADAPAGKPRLSQAGALSTVLAAAVVALFVSLSLIVVPHDTPERDAQPQRSSAAGPTVRPAAPPSPAPAAPPPAREDAAAAVPSVPDALAPADVPPAFAAPPEAAPPVAEPPAAAPPVAEPGYGPPAAPPPPPRLRDRIIGKFPSLNRFR